MGVRVGVWGEVKSKLDKIWERTVNQKPQEVDGLDAKCQAHPHVIRRRVAAARRVGLVP